jgi:alkylhydroperoxidase/carboxymuconolactone decarboxylase family protein YurZ
MRPSDPGDPVQLTDTPGAELPLTPNRLATARPELWAAFQKLGEQTSHAGPLSARERRLVHLALAIGADSQGATHSHARRAVTEGLSAADLEHVALLAITTLGWPQAMRGLTWIQDVTSGPTKA